MRVLVFKTSSLGDIIHTLPAITDAQNAIPNIQFDWVVEQNFAEVPSWHPAVAKVFPIQMRQWRQNLFHNWKNGVFRRFRQELRNTHYDLVIDAQGLFKNLLLSYGLQAPLHGFDFRSAREPLMSLFYQHKYRISWSEHAVIRLRKLFANALAYQYDPQIQDYGIRATLANIQSTPSQNEADYLILLHGTTWPHKHWPEKYWHQLIDIAIAYGLRVHIPWGNPAEHQRAQRLADKHTGVTVLPKLTLSQLAQQIVHARACVSVDSGLGHLAAALSVPTVTVYGPTDPKLVGTWGQNQIHLAGEKPCTPKDKNKCHYTLTPEQAQQFDPIEDWPFCFTQIQAPLVWDNLAQLMAKNSTPIRPQTD